VPFERDAGDSARCVKCGRRGRPRSNKFPTPNGFAA
jgi:hypothetical protein